MTAKPAGLCGFRFLEEFTCQRPAGHKGRLHKCTTSTGMRVSFTPFTEKQKAARARAEAKKEKMADG